MNPENKETRCVWRGKNLPNPQELSLKLGDFHWRKKRRSCLRVYKSNHDRVQSESKTSCILNKGNIMSFGFLILPALPWRKMSTVPIG